MTADNLKAIDKFSIMASRVFEELGQEDEGKGAKQNA